MSDKWLLEGAQKDRQTISADWAPAARKLIDGVVVREVVNVPKANGFLTEIVRSEWLGDNAVMEQVFQVVLQPGNISAWHAHCQTTDRLFVSSGLVRVVLYDAREGSPTFGSINDFRFGTVRPALVIVPPRVWHGVKNTGDSEAIVLNLPDKAYSYEDPDHWRVAADSKQIPFLF